MIFYEKHKVTGYLDPMQFFAKTIVAQVGHKFYSDFVANDNFTNTHIYSKYCGIEKYLKLNLSFDKIKKV